MKFNEAINEVRSHENTYDETSGTIQTFSVLDMIDELRQEYAPTVEMTKEDKKTLLYYLENSTFFSLIERKHAFIEVEMLGITSGSNEFLDLSDEDLMQAWLHPETVKVLDDEQ